MRLVSRRRLGKSLRGMRGVDWLLGVFGVVRVYEWSVEDAPYVGMLERGYGVFWRELDRLLRWCGLCRYSAYVSASRAYARVCRENERLGGEGL